MKLNRVSLNVVGLNRIGLNRIGSPSRRGSSGTDRPYIDPEVLASLRAVCICYGKSNDDADRSIVKNLVDATNPFIISNAAFKLNSGFGEYEVDFLDWSINSSTITERTSFAFSAINTTNSDIISIYQIVPAAVQSLKIKVNLSGRLLYRYYVNNGDTISVSYYEVKEGINILPDSVDPTSVSGKVGFVLKGLSSVKLEQIPSFEGAFVTDRIGDLITSTKTVQEMLGGSNEITVVSLITHISGTGKYNIIGDGGIQVSDYSGQTFMAGTSSSGEKIVELGDKEKLQAVQYTTFDSKLTIGLEDSSYAYYGTFVFNKKNVPVDWIHQVIAYFNLDRTLKPDILCNVKKQGITNENHAEFGDKLIDFSGNGRDIQLNNIAWKGDSGIGKYAADFTSWTTPKEVQKTSDTVKITTEYTEHWVAYLAPNNTFKSMKVLISGIPDGGSLQFFRTTADGGGIKMVNGINEIPEFTNTVAAGFYIDVPLGFDWSNLVIEQIPSHAGALCLDGVNDFGKVTGMPIYKDYTFIIDYERISYTSSEVWTASVVSKAHTVFQGAFILMLGNRESELSKQSNSFGSTTTFNRDDFTRTLLYQSKYKCGDVNLTVGEGIDGDTLWLGTLRDNDYRFFNGAIYSLMSFPYSMSEFLIERQLKKHKLGTLYPDMVEFRPIVKSNLPYSSITYSVNPGEYISVDSMVTITVTLPNTSDKLMEVSCNAISDISISGDNGVYEITGKIVKSPQKINLVISSYLTMLNNETLISNETLIKNE